ncbi:MAG: LLM class flavin-dependent oxidoreductase, partial [Chloroflexota bacterium]|nr:LLM class flavin-dependent oxidoreductase [Chloroflexota bacterium]
VQDRIPFTLGAHGPRMMRIVARYADRWNSIGTVEEMAARNTSLDEACLEVGRPPSEVLRSHLYVKGILPQEVNPWESPEALRDFVGRFSEIGIREFILQPPPGTEPAQIERTAETIAELRAGGVR